MSDCIRNARLRVLFDVFVMRDIVFIIDEYVVGGMIFIRRSVLDELKQKTIVFIHEDVLFDWEDYVLFSGVNEMKYLCMDVNRKKLINMFKFVFGFGGGGWWAAEASRLQSYSNYHINILIIYHDRFVVDGNTAWIVYMSDDTRTYISALLEYFDCGKMKYWKKQLDEFNEIGTDEEQVKVVREHQLSPVVDDWKIEDVVQPPPLKRRRL